MPEPLLAKGSLSRSPSAAARAASTVRAARADVFYPSSDGRPMAENMWQGDAILHAVVDLRAARPRALVAADILTYPEEGNPHNSIAPDVLVAFGIGTHKRSVYKVWEEGKPPDWVLEVASPSTEANDRGDLTQGASSSCSPAEGSKRERYAAMGVGEYWLFDAKGGVYPRGTPRLQGLELVAGEYRPLPSRLVDGERMIHSEALRLDVYRDGELLRFRDPATGRSIRHRDEADAATARAEATAARAEAKAKRETAERKAAQARAEREAAARSAAEARVAELEAALRRRGLGDSP